MTSENPKRINMDDYRFRHLRNNLFHFWIQNPSANVQETLIFLGKCHEVPLEQSGLKEYIEVSKKDFDAIPVRKKEPWDDLPPEEMPIFANPFMYGD
jgi:hypothetical protein